MTDLALEVPAGHTAHPYTAGVIARDLSRHYLLTRGQLPCPYHELVRSMQRYATRTAERVESITACTEAIAAAVHAAGGDVDTVAVVLGGPSGAPQAARECLLVSGLRASEGGSGFVFLVLFNKFVFICEGGEKKKKKKNGFS